MQKENKKQDIVLCHGHRRVRGTCKHTEGSDSGSIPLDILCLHCRNLGFVSYGKGPKKSNMLQIQRPLAEAGNWHFDIMNLLLQGL